MSSSGGTDPQILNLGTRLRRVSVSRHDRFNTEGSMYYPLNRIQCGSQTRSRLLAEKNISPTAACNQCSCIEYIIPAPNAIRHLIFPFSQQLFKQSKHIYLNINQLDALNFIMSLFHASTCFEHMCSSSGGQNCTIQSLVSSHWNEWSKITKTTKIIKTQFYKYEHTVVNVFILIELYFSNFSYFSNFRPLSCFSVMIPEAV